MTAASKYMRIPRVQRVRRVLSDDTFRFHYYHRPTKTPLPDPHDPGFQAAYEAAERLWLPQQAVSAQEKYSKPGPPLGTSARPSKRVAAPSIVSEPGVVAAQPAANSESAEQPHDQSPATAQPSPQTPSATPKVVTRQSPNRALGSPREVAVKIVRRRAAVTQADIARIIRAAKQAGAAVIEVRLNDSASVVVRLQPDNSLASDEEIVL